MTYRDQVERIFRPDLKATAAEREAVETDPLGYWHTLGGHLPPGGWESDDDWPPGEVRRDNVVSWMLEDWKGPPSRLTSSTDVEKLPDREAFATALRGMVRTDMRGLYLTGRTGAGKTRTAIAAVVVWALVHRRMYPREIFGNELLRVRDDLVAWVSGTSWATMATSATKSHQNAEELIDRLSHAPILVIDDLGHRLPQAGSDILLEVVRNRIDDGCGRKLVITSQYRAAELEAENQALAAVIRRFREDMVGVLFQTEQDEQQTARRRPRARKAKGEAGGQEQSQ